MARVDAMAFGLAYVIFVTTGAFAQSLPATAPTTGPTTHAARPPLRLVIVGDSTVCDYPKSRPDRGWGMFVGERFKDGAVQVINLAASGRSTKTFIQEGRWKKALDETPDYVLIQFGHNDSHDPKN